MNDQFKNMLDDALEQITETLEKAKSVLEISDRLNSLLEDQEFPVVMSVLNIALAKAIIDASDSYGDAYAYASRVVHTLVDVIDKHKEKQKAQEEDEDDDEEDEPVH